MSELTRDEMVRLAVERHFLAWAYSEPIEGIVCLGNKFDSHLGVYLQEVAAAREELTSFLDNYSEGEIASLSGLAKEPLDETREQDFKASCRDKKTGLPSFTGFDAYALGLKTDGLGDYSYWADMDEFSYEEFVWLSVGLEPLESNNHYFQDTAPRIRNIHPLVRGEVKRRLKMLKSARKFAFSKYRIFAADAFEWLQGVALEVPDRFREALEKGWERKNGFASEVAEPPAEAPDRRLVLSMQKLIIGMSMRGYSYDPEKTRNDAIADIQSDLDQLGIGLNEKTIREHLRKAANLLPDDAQQE